MTGIQATESPIRENKDKETPVKLRKILITAAVCFATVFYLSVFLVLVFSPDEKWRGHSDYLAPLRHTAPR